MWGRPVAVVISGLALVLAACGDQVVPGEEKVRPKLPVAGSAAASAHSAVATPGGAEPLLYPERPVEYRLAPGIEPPTRSAAAYRVVPEEVDGERVTRLAGALGLEGEVEASDEGTFTVQSGDRQLVVGTDSWNYIDDGGGLGSDVAVACAPGQECPASPPPPPPVGVPTAAEAEKKALELLSKAGVDLRGAEAQVDQDDTYARTVSFVPQAGGREVVGLDTSITFGEHGRLEQAAGFFGRFESVGEYPLIDLETAVERHRAGFGGAPRTLGGTPAAVGAEPATGSAPASSQADSEVVELTGVELVLEVVEPFCPGDTVYLVPAFAFEPDDVALVPAVADEELAGADQSPEAPKAPCPGEEPMTVPSAQPEPAPLPEPPPDIPPPDMPTSVPPDMPGSVPSEGPPDDGP